MSNTDNFIMLPTVDFCFSELMYIPKVRNGFIAAILKTDPKNIKETTRYTAGWTANPSDFQVTFRRQNPRRDCCHMQYLHRKGPWDSCLIPYINIIWRYPIDSIPIMPADYRPRLQSATRKPQTRSTPYLPRIFQIRPGSKDVSFAPAVPHLRIMLEYGIRT